MGTGSTEFEENGYGIYPAVYSADETDSIISCIEGSEGEGANFRKSAGLYAIRNVLGEIPGLKPLLFNKNLRAIINAEGEGYFLSKSIYFDKPPQSNWFVAPHQDLTINIRGKNATPGFINWVKKEGYYSVQPPIEIQESNFTLRIHLDDTDENNGALYVIPGSHSRGVVRVENMQGVDETVCPVSNGGVMFMKPLLFHASRRTTNNHRRRVLHLEFSNAVLPGGLEWHERMDI